MKKVAIVYWSGGGNTEAMANAVADGVKEGGGEATVAFCTQFDVASLGGFDSVAFGCPSMGAEQLEDTEFEPVFNNCKSNLGGKKVALFGSYGWGDGEWMRTWESDCRDAGIDLCTDSVICCETPDDEAKDKCRELGRTLAF